MTSATSTPTNDIITGPARISSSLLNDRALPGGVPRARTGERSRAASTCGDRAIEAFEPGKNGEIVEALLGKRR